MLGVGRLTRLALILCCVRLAGLTLMIFRGSLVLVATLSLFFPLPIRFLTWPARCFAVGLFQGFVSGSTLCRVCRFLFDCLEFLASSGACLLALALERLGQSRNLVFGFVAGLSTRRTVRLRLLRAPSPGVRASFLSRLVRFLCPLVSLTAFVFLIHRFPRIPVPGSVLVIRRFLL